EILNQIKAKKPFFLFLDHDIIHTTMKELTKGLSDMNEGYYSNKEGNLKLYLKLVEENRNYLEAMLAKIKELGLYDNSLILIFSDHGCSVGDKIGEFFYGVYLYDYTIRCFLYMIGKDLPKNVQVNSLVRSIDILPTILEILGIKQKIGYKPVQGKSFLPFVYGKVEERTAYSETGGLGGPTPSPEMHNVQSARTNKWKLIYNKTTKKKELYNIEKDPNEEHNLIGKEKEAEKKIEEGLWKKMEKLSKGDYNV
ncbi:sulfatase-like hydrolase/transferase, partial [Candidatus Woesearchaeota archaeon]|nr:sulfatase-like hydrolase/transferase [Candidatus Woesearchaeota archaeon]